MKQILLTTSFLIITLISFAQQEGSYEDSVLYVEPQTMEADLDMYTPPSSFEVSPAFNGYLDKAHGAGVIMMFITDLHFARLAEGMNEEFFNKNKLNFISETDFESDHGYKGKFYKFDFNHNNSRFIRYMVYAGDSSGTLWLTVTYNELVEEILELDLLDSFKSININVTENEGN